MSYVLRLEAIADDERAYLQWCKNQLDEVFSARGAGDAIVGSKPSRFWVAEITGACPKYKFVRVFLKGKKDYSQSNSIGSRGVYVYYILEEDRIYEVSAPVSWKRTDRYFCTITRGHMVRLTVEEVKSLEWLKGSLT